MSTNYQPGDDIVDLRDVAEYGRWMLDDPDEYDNDAMGYLRSLAEQFGFSGNGTDEEAIEALEDSSLDPTLIADDYFQDYARELAEEIGAIPSDYSWPASHIDWKAAADALRMDYTNYTYGGVQYWGRS